MSQFPQKPENWESFGNSFTKWLGRNFLALLGWKITGELPNENKLMIVVAPHTSNWDFPIGLAAVFVMGFKVHWCGKHSIFIWPINKFLVWTGGIPVVRHAPGGLADQITEQYRSKKQIHFAMAPEGTRSYTGKLKTGFLRMATAAEVPVLLCGLDFKKKEIIIDKLFHPSGDVEKDERSCYEYFKRYTARFPDLY